MLLASSTGREVGGRHSPWVDQWISRDRGGRKEDVLVRLQLLKRLCQDEERERETVLRSRTEGVWEWLRTSQASLSPKSHTPLDQDTVWRPCSLEQQQEDLFDSLPLSASTDLATVAASLLAQGPHTPFTPSNHSQIPLHSPIFPPNQAPVPPHPNRPEPATGADAPSTGQGSRLGRLPDAPRLLSGPPLAPARVPGPAPSRFLAHRRSHGGQAPPPPAGSLRLTGEVGCPQPLPPNASADEARSRNLRGEADPAASTMRGCGSRSGGGSEVDGQGEGWWGILGLQSLSSPDSPQLRTPPGASRPSNATFPKIDGKGPFPEIDGLQCNGGGPGDGVAEERRGPSGPGAAAEREHGVLVASLDALGCSHLLSKGGVKAAGQGELWPDARGVPWGTNPADSDRDEGGSGSFIRGARALWTLSQAPTPSASAALGAAPSVGSCSDTADSPSPALAPATDGPATDGPAADSPQLAPAGEALPQDAWGGNSARGPAGQACAPRGAPSIVYPPKAYAGHPPAATRLPHESAKPAPLLYPLAQGPAAPTTPAPTTPPAHARKPPPPAAPQLLPHLATAAAASAAPLQPASAFGGGQRAAAPALVLGQACERGGRKRKGALLGRLGQWVSQRGRLWAHRSPKASGASRDAVLLVEGGFVFSSDTQGEMVSAQRQDGSSPQVFAAAVGEGKAGNRGIRLDAFWQ